MRCHEALLLSLLQPCDPEIMQAFEVSRLVNSPRNNSPACLEPVPAYSPKRGRFPNEMLYPLMIKPCPEGLKGFFAADPCFRRGVALRDHRLWENRSPLTTIE